MSVKDPCSITCTKCGTVHAISAGGTHCRNCYGFLEEAEPWQERLVAKRMEQQIRYENGHVAVGGYVPGVHGPDYDSPDFETEDPDQQ